MSELFAIAFIAALCVIWGLGQYRRSRQPQPEPPISGCCRKADNCDKSCAQNDDLG